LSARPALPALTTRQLEKRVPGTTHASRPSSRSQNAAHRTDSLREISESMQEEDAEWIKMPPIPAVLKTKETGKNKSKEGE